MSIPFFESDDGGFEQAIDGFVDALPSAQDQVTWVAAKAVSIETGGTCTVQVRGTTVAGVVYQTPPRPGTTVWCVSTPNGELMAVHSFDQAPFWFAYNAVNSTANVTWQGIQMNTVGAGSWQSSILSGTGAATAPADGLWHIVGMIGWDGYAAGNLRAIRFWVNSATPYSENYERGSMATYLGKAHTSITLRLNKGDVVEMQGYQDSGVTLPVRPELFHTYFSGTWVGR